MTRMIGFLLATIWLAANSGVAIASCSPIPGADRIWTDASAHWVLVGELHGSNETPSAFVDLVCDGLAKGKHITVALERPTSEQPALQGMLKEPNLSAAQTALLSQPDWKNGMDGRASVAMLRLLVSLRELHASHPDLSVVGFDAPYTGTSAGARDEAMGKSLLSLGETKRGDMILVLTGNVHATKTAKFGYDFAAMFLPPKQVFSLEVTDKGGESWLNINGACGAAKGGVGDKGAHKPYGIYLDPTLAPFGTVDGVLSLGVPLTASPPAAGEPAQLPACRSKYISGHGASTTP